MTEILDESIEHKDETAVGRFFMLISYPETDAEPGRFIRELKSLPRAEASSIAKTLLQDLFTGEGAELADKKYNEGQRELLARGRADMTSPEIRFYAYVQYLSETSSLVNDVPAAG